MSTRKATNATKKPVEPETLNGSNTLPATIEIAEGQTLQLGELVAMSHQVSGLSVSAWNKMAEDKRDAQLQLTIESLKDAVAGGASLEDLKPQPSSSSEDGGEEGEFKSVIVTQTLIVSAPGGDRRRAGFAFGPEPVELEWEELGETDEDRKSVLEALRADPKLKIDGRMREVEEADEE